MRLIDVINAYVSLQRSLGMHFERAQRLLRQFARGMGDVRMDEIRPQQVADFLRGSGPLSATWVLKHKVLSGLYRFAISRGHANFSPLVYSTDELRRLIDATSALHVASSRLQAPTYRTLILVLYGSGLRIGEALGST